ncbi:DUF882 domain-containing protein [Granulosicoccaceae sp. 1_MG-2023]|nr:DUF882 domain-containing protein [Granulosicoccaceae sp. 1_MG-2023]
MQNADRRRFLRTSLAISGAVAGSLSSTALFANTQPERRIYLKNMHTGESVDTVYFSQGEYLSEPLAEISRVMRDHRRNEILPIDPALLDVLHDVHALVEAPHGIELFSGYRSPATNEALRARNGGVAKKSFHMYGKAADIRIPGVQLKHVRDAALNRKGGGVGYYARSGFVHVDTGRVRTWNGKS